MQVGMLVVIGLCMRGLLRDAVEPRCHACCLHQAPCFLPLLPSPFPPYAPPHRCQAVWLPRTRPSYLSAHPPALCPLPPLPGRRRREQSSLNEQKPHVDVWGAETADVELDQAKVGERRVGEVAEGAAVLVRGGAAGTRL